MCIVSLHQTQFFPLPSNNQCVKAGIKDAILCRQYGRSKCIVSHFDTFCVTVTSDVVYDVNKISAMSPLKDRRKKCKNNDWVCEILKIQAIIKNPRKFNPRKYSQEEFDTMQTKIGVNDHYLAGKVQNSSIKFITKINVDKQQN